MTQPLDFNAIETALTAYQQHPNLGFDCCTAHPAADTATALLAEVHRLTAELADFSGRVNELESRLCNCEPAREHQDYRRPAFYQHEAHCRVVTTTLPA